MKRILFLLLVLVLFANISLAVTIPGGGTLVQSGSGDYSILGNIVTIKSDVYSYISGEYVYAYQVANTSSVPLSFFSVAIYPGADVTNEAYDATGALVTPDSWGRVVVASQVVSVNAGFNSDTLDNNGISSATLWFKSTYAPSAGSAAVFGTSSGFPQYAGGTPVSGKVYVPTLVPEPTTIALLGLGMVALRGIKKRNGRKA